MGVHLCRVPFQVTPKAVAVVCQVGCWSASSQVSLVNRVVSHPVGLWGSCARWRGRPRAMYPVVWLVAWWACVVRTLECFRGHRGSSHF